ncbi:hypothetical protein N0V95_004039 [Ascochyta clinopodiicola]|nr:hypothetical protein N0V95_004039 [Ascochyta clinopodiicola]
MTTIEYLKEELSKSRENERKLNTKLIEAESTPDRFAEERHRSNSFDSMMAEQDDLLENERQCSEASQPRMSLAETVVLLAAQTSVVEKLKKEKETTSEVK